MKILLIIACGILLLCALIWLGLHIRPKPFSGYKTVVTSPDTLPLPTGLPTPVAHYYQTLYGDKIPVINSAVLTGRGVIKPVMGIPLPVRFVFVHEAGRNYRHYFEATFFGIPFMKVNEGIVDGKSFFESPMGSYHDDPNTNQGANLALWAEAGWFPSIFLTDSRVHWQEIDDHTALLFVPYQDKTETLVVRFNPETGLIDMMEAMRFRNPQDKQKILWLPRTKPGKPLPVTHISSTGSAMWLDQGQPWATFTLEDAVFNADLSQYIRQRGL